MSLKKIKDSSIFWRKVFTFSILFIIAVPLIFFIGISFKRRTQNINIIEEWKMPEITESLGDSLSEIEKLKKEFEEQFATTTNGQATTTE